MSDSFKNVVVPKPIEFPIILPDILEAYSTEELELARSKRIAKLEKRRQKAELKRQLRIAKRMQQQAYLQRLVNDYPRRTINELHIILKRNRPGRHSNKKPCYCYKGTCGKVFIPKSHTQIYCSKTCSNSERVKRTREMNEQGNVIRDQNKVPQAKIDALGSIKVEQFVEDVFKYSRNDRLIIKYLLGVG